METAVKNTAPAAAASSAGANAESAASVRIVFFCKDCEKIVDGIKIGRKYVYKCPVCGTKNVAFGTERSIKNFYHAA